MESGAIADSQITTNSVLNDDYSNYGPTLARFNGESEYRGSLGSLSLFVLIEKGKSFILFSYGKTFQCQYLGKRAKYIDAFSKKF